MKATNEGFEKLTADKIGAWFADGDIEAFQQIIDSHPGNKPCKAELLRVLARESAVRILCGETSVQRVFDAHQNRSVKLAMGGVKL